MWVRKIEWRSEVVRVRLRGSGSKVLPFGDRADNTGLWLNFPIIAGFQRGGLGKTSWFFSTSKVVLFLFFALSALVWLAQQEVQREIIIIVPTHTWNYSSAITGAGVSNTGNICRKSEFLSSWAPVSSQHTHALLPLWLWVLELNIKAHRSVGPKCHK